MVEEGKSVIKRCHFSFCPLFFMQTCRWYLLNLKCLMRLRWFSKCFFFFWKFRGLNGSEKKRGWSRFVCQLLWSKFHHTNLSFPIKCLNSKYHYEFTLLLAGHRSSVVFFRINGFLTSLFTSTYARALKYTFELWPWIGAYFAFTAFMDDLRKHSAQLIDICRQSKSQMLFRVIGADKRILEHFQWV